MVGMYIPVYVVFNVFFFIIDGSEMHYESYGMPVPRPMPAQPKETAWPPTNNTVSYISKASNNCPIISSHRLIKKNVAGQMPDVQILR